MAKIKSANVAPDAYPRIRGVLLTKTTKDGIIASQWPRPRGPSKTEAQQFLTTQWSIAAGMASNSEPMAWETAKFLSTGTVWMPRDILMMAIYGKLYELTGPNGEIYRQADHGYPGNANPLGDKVKQWHPNIVNAWSTAAASASAFASKGTAFIPSGDMSLFATTFNLVPVNGATYRSTIAVLNSSNVIQSVSTGIARTLTTSTRQNFTFAHPYNLIAGTRYAIMLSRTDSTDTYALPISNVADANWLFECLDLGYSRIAKKSPAVGQTVDVGPGSFGMQMLLEF